MHFRYNFVAGCGRIQSVYVRNRGKETFFLLCISAGFCVKSRVNFIHTNDLFVVFDVIHFSLETICYHFPLQTEEFANLVLCKIHNSHHKRQ